MSNTYEWGIPFTPEEWDMGTSQSPTMEKASQVPNGYGIKQAPRAWYAKIDGFLLSLNYSRCKSDPNLYLNIIHGSLIIIVLYLDENFITRSSK